MSNEADLIKIYSAQILQLTTELSRVGRLDAPSHSAKRRAPLCGSSVTVDLLVEDGVIHDYAHDVKACALGQAAASVVAKNIIGRSTAQVVATRDALARLLAEDGPVPQAPFEGFEVLRAAKDYKNRHASIMLSLDAACDALSGDSDAQDA
ncbi:iron-sulfur cluster assembly scaffold protein [Nereida sp.]|uniref:iron-sulfur cluster assembly scaffold protein n=1 Tax=Nereida sp. TaxID=2736090 RepID=UPI003F6990B1